MEKSKEKKILFITHTFPPNFSSGALRLKGFCQSMPLYGWESYALTIKEFLKNNNTLQSEKKIKRLFYLNSKKYLSVNGKHLALTSYPDNYITWLIPALFEGFKLIKEKKIKIIFSSYPVPTSHLIAYFLNKITGVKWIADFRDPMVQEGYPKEHLKNKIWQWIEKKTIEKACVSIFTTNNAMKYYKARYNKIDSNKFKVIENGFLEEDFNNIDKNIQNNSGIRLVHAGSLYASERDPRFLFKAVKLLISDPEINNIDFFIDFYGAGDDSLILEYNKYLKELEIENSGVIRFVKALPHDKMLAELYSADILLLMQAANCNYQIPAKAYEYFRIGKPILALTDKSGDTADLINKNHAGYIASLDDSDEIALQIKSLILKLNNKQKLKHISQKSVSLYNRETQAERLAKLLDEILDK